MSLLDFDKQKDFYAVMGNPIHHSKSPLIHSLFARQTGQRLEYTAIQVDPGGFAQAVGNFQANGGKGLNITVPFKQEAWEWVATRTPRAQLAGAVNTISFAPDGSAIGDNTDGTGLVQDITSNLATPLAAKHIVILGAGGAVRGVLGPLLALAPASVIIANRTASRAQELAHACAHLGPIQGCGFDELIDAPCDILINGTAASLQGALPPLPRHLVTPATLCYDMMYGAAPTVFMVWCRQQGATIVADGLGMLVEQAAEAFFIWRKIKPQTAPVIAEVRRRMAASASQA